MTNRVYNLILAVLLALTLFSLVGCGPQIVSVPDKPDFAPIKAAAEAAQTAATDTSAKAQAVVTVLEQHQADVQPAAKAVVADALPKAQATTQAAAVTVKRVAAIAPTVAPVEKQAGKVYESAVTNHDAAVKTKAALKKEQTSWFGGRLGHILWWTIFCGVLAGVLFGLSRLALAGAGLAIPGLGILTDLANLIHPVANLIGYVASAAWAGIKWVFAKVQYFWDEVILAHIPWPTKPAPTASSQAPATPTPATP